MKEYSCLEQWSSLGGLQTWKRDYLEAYDTDVQTILGIETGEIKWLVNISSYSI